MQLLNWHDAVGKPNMVGTFDVCFTDGTIYSQVRIIRTKKGGLMVTFPAKCEKDAEGKFTFHPYIIMPKHKHDDFQKEVLALAQPFMPKESSDECPF